MVNKNDMYTFSSALFLDDIALFIREDMSLFTIIRVTVRILGLRISSWEGDSLDHNPRYCEGSVFFIHRRGRSVLFIHPRGRFQELIIQSLLADGTHRRERKAHGTVVVSVFAAGEGLALVGGETILFRCCAGVRGVG